ncbi:MAG: manganese-binding transcriptional regulator MntR [Clostridia bacterium]|nr:manganese-binding transcriptional regulator MntR [Deltaproteobacteria bacterium]
MATQKKKGARTRRKTNEERAGAKRSKPSSEPPTTKRPKRGESNRYVRAREARQTEVAEDYVELIDELIAAHGEARTVMIAEVLGVSQPTVTNTIRRLSRDGLVTARRYRAIFLTEMGLALAARSRERHRIVRDFLTSIGVSLATAETDAEGVEHHVSEETLAIFERLTRRA